MWTSSTRAAIAYRNPVFGDYFADPFLFRHGGLWYAVGTGAEEAEGAAGGLRRAFPMLSSPDMVHWTPLPHALREPDPVFSLGDAFWAPEIAEEGGLFFLYYSVGTGDKSHHLRVACSDAPAGPYRDLGALHANPDEWRFAIDPHPFRDADGRWYLFFAADFLDGDPAGTPGGIRPGTALVAQALEGMTRLAPGPGRTVLRARCEWQRFRADREMYGGRYDWHTLEGPTVRLREGRYYCFYSGGCWQDQSYGVDYAVADHVLGPYSGAGGEGGPRILRTVPGKVLGPGHNSIVEGPDGETWIAYHAWDPERTARRLCLDRLEWGPEGPSSPGPTWTTQAL